MKLRGTYTAIISPFKSDQTFDAAAFEKLVVRQVDAGVEGIVVVGTTGEAPTVDIEESIDIFELAREIAGHKLQLIFGLTSNSTKTLLKYVAKINPLRPSAILSATPYYNKPTQKGILEHFTCLANETDLPIVLYNVPGRAAANIDPSTVVELSRLSNIIGIKEASGSLSQVRDVLEGVPESFSVLSGNDDQNVEIIKLGGRGTISVASNVIPVVVKKSVDAALEGDFDVADALDQQYAQFYKDIFIENNPQSIKTLLAHLGLCQEVFRLPMTTMLPHNRERLIASWQAVEKFTRT
jgi:4-hydroxy-tetrahydrodipicolinate synthase